MASGEIHLSRKLTEEEESLKKHWRDIYPLLSQDLSHVWDPEVRKVFSDISKDIDSMEFDLNKLCVFLKKIGDKGDSDKIGAIISKLSDLDKKMCTLKDNPKSEDFLEQINASLHVLFLEMEKEWVTKELKRIDEVIAKRKRQALQKLDSKDALKELGRRVHAEGGLFVYLWWSGGNHLNDRGGSGYTRAALNIKREFIYHPREGDDVNTIDWDIALLCKQSLSGRPNTNVVSVGYYVEFVKNNMGNAFGIKFHNDKWKGVPLSYLLEKGSDEIACFATFTLLVDYDIRGAYPPVLTVIGNNKLIEEICNWVYKNQSGYLEMIDTLLPEEKFPRIHKNIVERAYATEKILWVYGSKRADMLISLVQQKKQFMIEREQHIKVDNEYMELR